MNQNSKENSVGGRVMKAEIPDPDVRTLARSFRASAEQLYGQVRECGIAPCKMIALFAIELFLKSLNSERRNTPEGNGVFQINSRSRTKGHNPSVLFEAIKDTEIRKGLEGAFQRQRDIYGKTLLEQLTLLDGEFDKTRYCFEFTHEEYDGGVQTHAVLETLGVIGDYVNSLPKRCVLEANDVVSLDATEILDARKTVGK